MDAESGDLLGALRWAVAKRPGKRVAPAEKFRVGQFVKRLFGFLASILFSFFDYFVDAGWLIMVKFCL